MQQLKMQAVTAERKEERALPQGYMFEKFNGSEKDIADWKLIINEAFMPSDGPDSCYHLAIEVYPDCVPTRDIWFITNERNEHVATITTITHKDGSGYVHMVAARESERGKGLGHSMARYALKVFADRGVEKVILTTDDFRLAAVKTYIDAGFNPVIYQDPDSDMNVRWDAVLEKLGYTQVKRIVE